MPTPCCPMPCSSPPGAGRRKTFLEVAEASFAFLDRKTTTDGHLLAGRQRGLVSARGGKGALRSAAGGSGHDGRSGTGRVRTCSASEKYLAAFRRARGWFHGQNSLATPLVDARQRRLLRRLHPAGVNRNQGAESTLAYLWTELRRLECRGGAIARRQSAVAALSPE